MVSDAKSVIGDLPVFEAPQDTVDNEQSPREGSTLEAFVGF